MANTNEKQKDYSNRVAKRMIELIDKNEIFFSDELKIFQVISDKYQLMSISDYAKHCNCAYNTVVSEIKNNRIATVKINKHHFILEKLN